MLKTTNSVFKTISYSSTEDDETMQSFKKKSAYTSLVSLPWNVVLAIENFPNCLKDPKVIE